MKQFFSLIISITILCLNIPSSFADDNEQVLIDAIYKTFLEKNVKIVSDAEVSYGSSFIKGIENISSKDKKYQYNADFSTKINSSDLPKEALESVNFDSVGANFSVIGYADINTMDFYGTLQSLNVDISSSDKNVKKIVEGFSQYPKILTEKTFHINIGDDFIKMIGENEDVSKIIENYIEESNLYQEDMALIFEALIESGIIIVKSSDGKVFELSILNDANNIDFLNLYKLLKKSKIFKEMDLIDQLSFLTEVSDSDIVSLNAFLQQFNTFVNHSVKITVNNNKIDSIDISFIIKTNDIATSNGASLEKELHDIKISEKMKLSYEISDLSYSPVEKNTIHITKIIEAIDAIQNNVSDTLSTFSQEVEETKSSVVEEITSDIPDDAWYKEHAKNLAKNGIIYQTNPSKIVTKQEVYDYLSALTGKYYYDIEGPEKEISKMDAIKIIITELNPNVKNPIKEAINDGIIKNDSNIEKLKNSSLNEAELYKIFDMTMQLYQLNQNQENEFPGVNFLEDILYKL